MENKKEELSLESGLLKPMKENLEKAIKTLTTVTLNTHKETEIALKINISIDKKFKEGKEWVEPNFEYIIKEKIKEAKVDFKQNLGIDYSIEIDEENNILIEKISKQESLFDENDETSETVSDNEAGVTDIGKELASIYDDE